MILVDTSVLVEGLGRSIEGSTALRAAMDRGERLGLCAPVLYEWLRGPRTPDHVAAQEALFPPDAVWPFGAAEALVAAGLYKRLPRARRRGLDLAIAACALTHGAALWTLNPGDFADIPDLTLYSPDRT